MNLSLQPTGPECSSLQIDSRLLDCLPLSLGSHPDESTLFTICQDRRKDFVPSNMTIENPALPPDSVVLITGVNGLVGSHVADQVLLHGYKVRGAVRNAKKNGWMVDFFGSRYGQGKFELVEIPDLTKEGAFVEAVKGRSRPFDG